MAGTEASQHCPNLPTPTLPPRAPPTTRNGTSQTAPAKALTQQPQDETGASAWEAAFAIAGQRNHTDEPQLECSQGPQAHAKSETGQRPSGLPVIEQIGVPVQAAACHEHAQAVAS